MEINKENYLKIIKKMQLIMESKKIELTRLDAAIGDGDHGLNMAKGFSFINLDELRNNNLAEINKNVALILISKIGGTSGPLYGSMFLQFAMVIGDKDIIDLETFLTMLKETKKSIELLGKAKEGEKTILDAICPFIKKLEETKNLDLAIQAAFEATENTKNYQATKGRASYLGKRSIGYQDPGATSFSYLISCFK